MTESTKFCIKCGEKLSTDTLFCPKCGSKQPVVSQEVDGDTATTSNTQKNDNQVKTTATQPTRKKVGAFLSWGWVATVISLFIPFVGIAGFVLGILTIQRKHTGAGVCLLVFSILFFYLGITGFGTGFMNAL
ncbi:hypothetical protein IMAU50024_01199 [Lactobacillus helveticus]|uniref:zinc-ribbon domain-containing protein n=1 Tax=Lactobacillus helveticus TaxID=1587 RepID=UPI0015625B57|nr:zinc ribbon domain-containing protein [Lactobacillus helveticus]NRO52653.1 hypothetical protein [Lactobacillus helveticus]